MFLSGGSHLKLHAEDGVQSGTVPHVSPGSKVVNATFCNDNTYVALLWENAKPQIFSAKDKRNLRLIHTINVSNATAVTFKRNTKKTIALGTRSGDVILYDTKARTVATVYPKVADSVKALDFTSDDRQLCGLNSDTFFVFPEINSSSTVNKYKQVAECTCLKCHPFIPDRVALGLKNGRVSVWNAQEGIELMRLDLVTGPVTSVTMSSCGNFLTASGRDLKICGIDVEGGCCKFQYHVPQEAMVSSVDLSPDDKFLAVGLTSGVLKLYDIKQQLKMVFCEKAHETAVNVVVFENKAKETNSNFSSVVKLSEQDLKEEESVELSSNVTSTKNKSSRKEEALEKLKKNITKLVKTEMDCLESQLNEHCTKFQQFLDNEFETIDAIIKKKWDVFKLADSTQLTKMFNDPKN